jgi:hypothetical protein
MKSRPSVKQQLGRIRQALGGTRQSGCSMSNLMTCVTDRYQDARDTKAAGQTTIRGTPISHGRAIQRLMRVTTPCLPVPSAAHVRDKNGNSNQLW